MSDSVEARVRAFILSNFMVPPEDANFQDTDSLLGLGIIDSLGVLELAGFLKSEFGVDVAVDEIRKENFDSIRAIATFVSRVREP